jgi:anti-anti-sigma factor
MTSGTRTLRPAEMRMFEVSHIHNISVVNVAGDLSRHNMRFLEEVFNSFLDRGQIDVILNFADLKHIDYQLIRRLADHIVFFQCEGGDIKIASASPYIRQILEVMGLEADIFPSVEDALMSFPMWQPDGDLQ